MGIILIKFFSLNQSNGIDILSLSLSLYCLQGISMISLSISLGSHESNRRLLVPVTFTILSINLTQNGIRSQEPKVPRAKAFAKAGLLLLNRQWHTHSLSGSASAAPGSINSGSWKAPYWTAAHTPSLQLGCQDAKLRKAPTSPELPAPPSPP